MLTYNASTSSQSPRSLEPLPRQWIRWGMRVRAPILSVCSSSDQRAEGSENVLLKIQVASISLFVPREKHLKPPAQPIALADLRPGPRSGRSVWSVYWQRNVATKLIIALCWIMVMWQCFPQGPDRKSSALLQGNLSWERNPGPFHYVLDATLVSSPFNFMKGLATKFDVLKCMENDTPNDNPTLINDTPLFDSLQLRILGPSASAPLWTLELNVTVCPPASWMPDCRDMNLVWKCMERNGNISM